MSSHYRNQLCMNAKLIIIIFLHENAFENVLRWLCCSGLDMSIMCNMIIMCNTHTYPDSKFHGAHMGPIWGRQDPGGYHVGPMKLAIWVGPSEYMSFGMFLCCLRYFYNTTCPNNPVQQAIHTLLPTSIIQGDCILHILHRHCVVYLLYMRTFLSSK